MLISSVRRTSCAQWWHKAFLPLALAELLSAWPVSTRTGEDAGLPDIAPKEAEPAPGEGAGS
jgi:hypothetical protein